jgi:hypothetical protein
MGKNTKYLALHHSLLIANLPAHGEIDSVRQSVEDFAHLRGRVSRAKPNTSL